VSEGVNVSVKIGIGEGVMEGVSLGKGISVEVSVGTGDGVDVGISVGGRDVSVGVFCGIHTQVAVGDGLLVGDAVFVWGGGTAVVGCIGSGVDERVGSGGIGDGELVDVGSSVGGTGSRGQTRPGIITSSSPTPRSSRISSIISGRTRGITE
jgi:hypothetical protein